jgi:hypothetical protein
MHALALPFVTLLVACTSQDAPGPSEPDGNAPVAVPQREDAPPESAAPESSAAAPSAAAAPEEDGSDIVYCDPEAPPVKPSPDRRLYTVWQSLRVALDDRGGTGTLRLLEDSRVTRRGADRSGTHPMLPPCDLLPARLELIDAHGSTLGVERFSPEVDIVAHEMGPGAVVFETIERIHCLASCWCGDGHAFWRVDGGRLAPHRSRIVEKQPPGRLPAVGSILQVQSVTHGCYESSGFTRDASGRVMLVVNRMAMGSFVSAEERHWFEDGEWRTSIVDRKN